MKLSDFDSLTSHDFSSVMRPLQRGRVLKNYVDVAFDSEFYVEHGDWDSKSGMFEVKSSTCISIQFAVSKDKKAIFYPLKSKITWLELLNYTLKFFDKYNIEVPPTSSGKRHIFFIVFFGQAELSQISDFRDTETELQLYSHKAISAKRFIKLDGDEYVLHMIDLRGYFKGSLADLARSIGAKKLEITVDGKPHSHWIAHMLELYEKHPRLFKRYALRDVEVTIEIWDRVKSDALKSGLDSHSYRTLAGLTMAEFRLHMKNFPCKYKMVEETYARKNSEAEFLRTGNEYKIRKRKRYVYDGDWNVRKFACLSYAGGNNQAFCRGYLQDLSAKFYDFISLYITATMIQPLPNEFTEWKKLALSDVNGHEGFCRVIFKFPETEMYPCLPIQLNILNKLLFPLEGETYCTLSELRQALKCDVKILDFQGFGFLPSDNEMDHELRPFFSELLKTKAYLKASGKKGPEYDMVKSKLVSTVGKFGARSKKYNVRAIGYFMKRMETPEAFRKIARTKIAREMYESKGAVSSSWVPEWASLILGNSRACASEVIHTPNANCLFISTDGGVWGSEPHFNRDPPPLLKKMIRFGGGIHPEGDGDGSIDELWIARNRLYCTWYHGEIVKFARMGCALRKEDFPIFIDGSIKAGEPIADATERMILTGLFHYDFNNVPINSELWQQISLSFREGGKRIILNPDVNIWRDYSLTKPYVNVDDAFDHWYNIKPTGRPKVLTDTEIAEIRSMPPSITHKILAKKYGVSISTIKRVRR